MPVTKPMLKERLPQRKMAATMKSVFLRLLGIIPFVDGYIAGNDFST